MRFLIICICLFFVACYSLTNIKYSTDVTSIKKKCLDSLKLEKKEYIFERNYLVKKRKRSPKNIIIETIRDSIPLEVLTNINKKKLIDAITNIGSIDVNKLKTVKDKTCGLFFNSNKANTTIEINPNYSFFISDSFDETKGVDKEEKILQKYIDSSDYYFRQKPLCYDKGTVYKFKNEKNKYYFKNYKIYSNDGGKFWTVYKSLNILNYNNKRWLNSAIQYLSFFTEYSSEEKRFTTEEENEMFYKNIIWCYTFLETELDKNNSFIEYINVYHIELDNEDLSEQCSFRIQKEQLKFNK